MLSYEPSQTLIAQRTRIDITNRVAFLGFLNQQFFCYIHNFSFICTNVVNLTYLSESPFYKGLEASEVEWF